MIHPAKLLTIHQRNRIRRRLGLAEEEDFLSPFERRHQCVFFHIPKTGGIAISESLLEGHHTNHRIYRRCALADPRTMTRYWKFCILRDPVDRFVSAYRFLRGGGINEQDSRFRKDHREAFGDFPTFVAAFREDSSIQNYVHFRPQTFFVSDENGVPCLDFAGHFGSLPGAFARICGQLGIRGVELQSKNRTNAASSVPTVGSREQEILTDFYRCDLLLIARFARST